MKRVLALVLAFCMMIPFAVFAEPTEVSTANISGTTYNVYIEGETDAKDVSIMLRNEDGTDVAYVDQLNPDAGNGKYVAKFKFNGNIDNYGIYVRDNSTGEDVSASVKSAVAKDELYTASLDVAVDAADRTYIAAGDAVNVSVEIKNKYGDNATMKVLVAGYGKNGELKGVNTTSVSALFEDLSAVKNGTTSFKVPADTEKVKVFIWNDTETLIPVAPSKMLVNEDKAITVHLVGDSLCQKYGSSVYPREGWGAFIKDYVAEGVNVNNTGVASRSTFSYLYGEPGTVDASGKFTLKTLKNGIPYYDYENSRWNKTFIEKAKPGDYVIIALGINDLYQSGSDIWELDGVRYTKVKENGVNVYKVVESYDLENNTVTYGTESLTSVPSGATKIYSWIALNQNNSLPAVEGHYRTYFKDNLRTMLDTALEAGVTPILSSTTGHYGEKNYDNNSFNSAAGLTVLFEEMKEVAEEEKYKNAGVVYLPLFEYTDEEYHKWGNKARFDAVHLCDGAYEWFEKYGDQEVKISYIDGVHYNVNGAKWVASNIMRMVYESGSSLKEFINEPDVFDLPTIK